MKLLSVRPPLLAALPLALAALATLAGCSMFSAEAWQRPSPLSGRPPPPEKQGKHESQGGFTVLLDNPDRPSATRVMADIGAFAQSRGFVLRSAASPQRYALGNVLLDVIDEPSDVRVIALLHGSGFALSHRFADRFYHDFDQQYAGRYGEGDPIFENDLVDDAAILPGARGGGEAGNDRAGRGSAGRQ